MKIHDRANNVLRPMVWANYIILGLLAFGHGMMWEKWTHQEQRHIVATFIVLVVVAAVGMALTRMRQNRIANAVAECFEIFDIDREKVERQLTDYAGYLKDNAVRGRDLTTSSYESNLRSAEESYDRRYYTFEQLGLMERKKFGFTSAHTRHRAQTSNGSF